MVGQVAVKEVLCEVFHVCLPGAAETEYRRGASVSHQPEGAVGKVLTANWETPLSSSPLRDQSPSLLRFSTLLSGDRQDCPLSLFQPVTFLQLSLLFYFIFYL